MGLGLVGPFWYERIGLWFHSLVQSSHSEHVEVAWVLDAETCGVILQYIQE